MFTITFTSVFSSSKNKAKRKEKSRSSLLYLVKTWTCALDTWKKRCCCCWWWWVLDLPFQEFFAAVLSIVRLVAQCSVKYKHKNNSGHDRSNTNGSKNHYEIYIKRPFLLCWKIMGRWPTTKEWTVRPRPVEVLKCWNKNNKSIFFRITFSIPFIDIPACSVVLVVLLPELQ